MTFRPSTTTNDKRKAIMLQFYFNPNFLSAGTMNRYYKFAVVLDDGTCFGALRQHGPGMKTRAQSFVRFEKDKHAGCNAYNFDTDFMYIRSEFENNQEAREFLVYVLSHFPQIIKKCDFKDRHHLAINAVNNLLATPKVIDMLNHYPFVERQAERASEGIVQVIDAPFLRQLADSEGGFSRFIARYNGESGKYFVESKQGSFYSVKYLSENIATLIDENNHYHVISNDEITLFKIVD